MPRSVVGFVWPVLIYMALVAVKGFFLSGYFASQIPNYTEYLLLTLIAWGGITALITSALFRFVEYKPIFIQLPNTDVLIFSSFWLRELFVGLIKYLCAVIFIVFFSSAETMFVEWLVSVLGFILLTLFLGFSGYFLAMMVMRWRDLGPLVTFIVGLLYFALPILYYEEFGGAPSTVFEVNPLYYFIRIIRHPIIDNLNIIKDFMVCGLCVLAAWLLAWLVRTFLYKKMMASI